MTDLITEKSVQAGLQAVKIFLESQIFLIGVLVNYSDSIYCKGVIFGSTGAQMLMNIYDTTIPIITRIEF